MIKKGFVLWFTGLPASGKTTTAEAVLKELKKYNLKIEKLDGDIVRSNLTKDLSFSKKDRDENLRRIGFIANLLSRNNIAVVASFISPYKKQREYLRENVNNFIEIFVDSPLSVCEKRDPKGMYKKARSGKIKNFTGVDDPYEIPESPDIHLNTSEGEIKDNVKKVMDYLFKNNFLSNDTV
jgi:adenylylsulfate kinase